MDNSLLILSILVLGLRHGIDWDHVAAISGIVSSAKNNRQAIINGFVYAIGHAVVVIFLGLLAIILGVSLPPYVGQMMGPLVGVTLIVLGLWIILSILVKKKDFRFVSRWMLIFQGIARVVNFLTGKHEHHKLKYPQNFGIKTSFLIGTVHGIGAETPTQILLFVTAAGVGGGIQGGILLLIFVLGLLISNSAVVLLSLLGFMRARGNSRIYMIFGILVGLMSLIVGFLFLSY